MTKEELEALEAQKNKENQENPDNKDEKEEFVPRKAYEEISNDMHKKKRLLKETQAELARLKAEREIEAREALKAQEDWKGVAERIEAENQELAKQNEKIKKASENKDKIRAVIQAIGGFKKDSYVRWIEVDNIAIDENGNVNTNDVQREADRIRQEYPELLKSSKSVNLPNEAPNSDVGGEKSYNQMTEAEKAAYKRKLLMGGQ